MPVTISALAVPELSPVPLVRLTVEGAGAAGAAFVRVTRTSSSGNPTVRGAWKRVASDVMVIDDVEAPFSAEGVASTYAVQLLDAGGLPLDIASSAPVVLAFRGTVLHQVLDPTRAVLVTVPSQSARSQVAPFSGELTGNGTWVGTGRRGLTGVALPLFTRSAEQEAAMLRVFGSESGDMPIVVLRSSVPFRLPQPFFALVREPQMVGVDWDSGGSWNRWEFVADEVRPPAPSLLKPPLTWDDVQAYYGTWTAVRAAKATWAELMSDYSIAGMGSQ